ncbi:ABC transporter substrate-binding protein [Clostridium butyricum]|uniref:ABC transporter substrate-binding protein n=1 Tax=Clostridium butyricum TaxID=1492 RepID=UPI0013D72950|nr:ABC transporter substrate-binding protein [Clostridium butyricum]NFB72636.1 peptide ABC transporter substrate-binding protein [Clostridium butyricum]NFB92405.1 peptide ABC transporter substrate-binding protein [Clostridium butyricum]
MKKYIILILITIIIVAFGISFIEYDDSSAANVGLQEGITYGVESIPNDLKNISELSSSDKNILCALTKGLVEKNKEGEIVPSLASEVNKSEDGIQYEFKIRDDVYWSDGSKVTGKDVVTFFKELLKECNDDEITCLLQVYGAKDFRDGKVSFDKGVAINCSDDSVTIRLNNKYDRFLEELSKPQYRLRSNIIMWNDIMKNYNNLLYCGDYKIKSADKGNITLEKNNDSVKFKRISFTKDDSVELSMASYEVNERDIVINPPESELNKLKDSNKLITIQKNSGAYIVMNNSSIPMQGRRIVYNYIYKAIGLYQSNNTSEYDLAEGCYFREEKDNLNMIQQRKVDSSKEGEWNQPKVLTLIAEDNKKNKILCRIIKEWFAANTNITIKYTLANDDEFKDLELKKRYDVIIVNNDAISSEKEEFYSRFEEYLSEDDLNILESLRINDYYGDYHTLEDSLFSNYNILPLAFYNENIAISDKVSDISIDGNGNIDFHGLN